MSHKAPNGKLFEHKTPCAFTDCKEFAFTHKPVSVQNARCTVHWGKTPSTLSTPVEKVEKVEKVAEVIPSSTPSTPVEKVDARDLTIVQLTEDLSSAKNTIADRDATITWLREQLQLSKNDCPSCNFTKQWDNSMVKCSKKVKVTDSVKGWES